MQHLLGVFFRSAITPTKTEKKKTNVLIKDCSAYYRIFLQKQDTLASAETNSWSWYGAGTSAQEILKTFAGIFLPPRTEQPGISIPRAHSYA